MLRKNAKGKYLCSFCEKSQGNVELIIAGSEANICNECVGICNEIIEDFNKRGKTIQALEKITEPELVRFIMAEQRALYSTLGFMLGWAFNNEGAVISRPNPKFDSLLIALEVPRSELQLNSDQAPGDIDMLIVPQNEGHNLYDKTMAVEVKIVRPTVINPSRNANSLGEKQSNKLVNGGFPYVGLLHLIIPEPSPEHLLEETIIRSIGAPKGVISPPDRKGKIDMFPIDSTHRQLGRLRKLRIPDFVGFSATSLVIGIKAGNGQTYLDMIAQSIDMDKEVKPNPNSSHKLQEKVKEHVENYTHRYLNIKWFA